MNCLALPIAVPLAAGLLAFCAPRSLARHLRWFAVLVTAVTFGLCIALFAQVSGLPADKPVLECSGCCGVACEPGFLQADRLSALVLLGVGFFSFVISVYSAGFFAPGAVSERSFYANLLLSVGAACGVAVAADARLLVVFWGLLGIPLYLLINCASDYKANSAAKKTMLVLGATDSILVLGVAAFFVSTGGFGLFPPSPVLVADTAAWFGLICFLIAALAKAGAMPFHSWVPDACEAAPVPAVALLPASLDKLLGIYLLARVFLTIYSIPDSVRVVCLLVGAGTIVFAVMAALVQHNLRRLLGFHAVSQVGYMVVGIATGTAAGVVGGLFHMLNHAIYKSCLFLTAGAAERKTGETELDRMGALATAMPAAFVSAAVAAAAISGVPPFNGFASKWMVYNGIIAARTTVGPVWVLVLVAAMFGSALTLASFVKVLHSVFLGQPKKRGADGGSPGFLMNAPMVVLALLCVVLGVGAVHIGVNRLVLPATGLATFEKPGFQAMWSPGGATALLLIALLGGVLIYALTRLFARARVDEPYVGGEIGPKAAEFNYEGVEFYKTVSELPVLRRLYRQAEAKWYDLYDLARRLTLYLTGWLRKLHDGSLHSYATWCVIGLVVILWCLLYTYRILGRAF